MIRGFRSRVNATNTRVRSGALAFAAGLALATTVPAGGAVAAPAKPESSPQVKVEAVIKPSLVYLTIEWEAWLRTERGTLVSDDSWEVTTTCSGAFVSSKGHILTAGHCVDDVTLNGGKGVILRSIAQEMVSSGRWTTAEAAAWLTTAQQNWRIEGFQGGSPPEREVTAYRAAGTTTGGTPEAMLAEVVEVKPFADGDVALLKVESPQPLPMIEIATEKAENGTEIIATGYPGSVTESTDLKLEPSFKDGRIGGGQTVSGVPFTEISAAASQGMSGGPVVDLNGRVLGTVSFSPSSETQPFNFMTATSAVNALVTRNAVPQGLPAPDKAYRKGLSLYFDGRYHDAVKEFDKVLGVQPNHAQAVSYRAKAVAQFPNEETGSGTGLILIIAGAGAVVLILLLALVALLVLRGRRRRRAAATTAVPVPYPPSYAPPIQAAPGAPQPQGYWPPGSPPVSPAPATSAFPPMSAPPVSPAPPAPTTGPPASPAPSYPAPLPAPPVPPAPMPAPAVSPAPMSAPAVSPAPMPAPAVPPATGYPAPGQPGTDAPAAPGGAAGTMVVAAPAAPPPPATEPAVTPAQGAGPASGAPAKYCTNCGAQRQPSMRFCPSCGQPLE